MEPISEFMKRRNKILLGNPVAKTSDEQVAALSLLIAEMDRVIEHPKHIPVVTIDVESITSKLAEWGIAGDYDVTRDDVQNIADSMANGGSYLDDVVDETFEKVLREHFEIDSEDEDEDDDTDE